MESPRREIRFGIWHLALRLSGVTSAKIVHVLAIQLFAAATDSFGAWPNKPYANKRSPTTLTPLIRCTE